MAIMRSVFYVPGNNEKMVSKAPSIPADIITLDLEDSVPPAEKPKAREVTRENLKYAAKGGAEVYVRINNWETLLTNDDLEAVVHEGINGICLAKCGEPNHVIRLDWKLEELERRRGIPVGTIKVQLLIETAKGVIHAYQSAVASSRVNSLIFGAVKFAHIRCSGLHKGYEGETDDRRPRALLRKSAHSRSGTGSGLRGYRLSFCSLQGCGSLREGHEVWQDLRI